jgi:hypothetical protein
MYNFINDKYKIDFAVPKGLQEYIDYAEKADKETIMGIMRYMQMILM